MWAGRDKAKALVKEIDEPNWALAPKRAA